MPPTFHRDIAPLLSRSCAKCHHDGGIGPFPLTSFAEAHAMAPALVQEVSARRMPPWGALDTAECSPSLPWHQDERLTDEEIRLFQQWNAAGAPEGDPNDAPVEVEAMQSLQLVAPMLELRAPVPFKPAATTADEFRCFVLDSSAVVDGGYVSAINVVPGNRQVVHHVSVFGDVGGIAASRAGADGSFECSGGSISHEVPGLGAPHLTWLLAWAPGARPLELPANLGIRLLPSSKIVMEVHYSAGGRDVEPDQTRVQLAMAAEKPEYSLLSWGLGNFETFTEHGDGLLPGPEDPATGVEFRVPAGARAHPETMLGTSWESKPMPIFGLRPHAHLGAIDIKVDLLPAAGNEQCLLQDRWDFHWQRAYTYDARIEDLPTVHRGDRVRVRCTYDNSMGNRRLGTELWQRGLQPTDLRLGDGTMSEMCMVDVLFIEKTP